MSIFNVAIKVNERDYSLIMDLDPNLPNERTIIGYVSNGKLYEPDVATAMIRILAPGDVAIDVGANIGFFSLLMGLLAGPEGRVVSFEPADNNLPRMSANIRLTQLANIIVVDKPASSIDEDVIFYINSDTSAGNALWDPGDFHSNPLSRSHPKTIQMRATTIDNEIDRLGLQVPKLIKVDTEGAEHQVLLGARRLLEDRKVPYVIAELHPFGLAKMKSSQMDLRRFMEGLLRHFCNLSQWVSSKVNSTRNTCDVPAYHQFAF